MSFQGRASKAWPTGRTKAVHDSSAGSAPVDSQVDSQVSRDCAFTGPTVHARTIRDRDVTFCADLTAAPTPAAHPAPRRKARSVRHPDPTQPQPQPQPRISRET